MDYSCYSSRETRFTGIFSSFINNFLVRKHTRSVSFHIRHVRVKHNEAKVRKKPEDHEVGTASYPQAKGVKKNGLFEWVFLIQDGEKPIIVISVFMGGFFRI